MTEAKPVPSDIEIAQAATLEPIEAIAEKMGLGREDIELYGDNMAKVKLETVDKLKDRPNAKYILITAITPTPLGEGKSTTTVGPRPGHAPHRQDGHHRHPPALAGPHLRHQGRRGRRRLQPGRAHGAVQPAHDRRHPRRHRGQQPARRHDRQPHLPGQRTRHRPLQHHLAARAGRQRPRPAQHRRRSGRQGRRSPAPDRL